LFVGSIRSAIGPDIDEATTAHPWIVKRNHFPICGARPSTISDSQSSIFEAK
jgi:hypothetical protein